MRPPVEAQATCVAGAPAAPARWPATAGTRVSPAPQLMKALPPFWRDIMFSTVARKP